MFYCCSWCVLCVIGQRSSEPRVPAYLPATFSIVIAIAAFAAVLWAYFHHRQNSENVEEANFEFYHTTPQGLSDRRQDPVTVKMVAHRVKLIWRFWRARAYRKVRDVLWNQSLACDENEMQEVTEGLLTGSTRSYSAAGTTVVNS